MNQQLTYQKYNPVNHFDIMKKWYMNSDILNSMDLDPLAEEELLQWLSEETRIHLIFFIKEIPVGCVNFYNWKTKLPNYEIGYLVDPDFQGKGYATEMVKQSLDYAKDILNAKKIEEVYVLESNPGSKKVLEKNDFVLDKFDEVKKRFYYSKELL